MSLFLSAREAFASETITVSNAVKQLTPATYDSTGEVTGTRINVRKARGALIEVDGANSIRYTEDGTTPVAATTGRVLNQADVMVLDGYQAIVAFKAIREGASDATLQVTYYR